MPCYESRCRQCGKVQDYYQSTSNCHVTPECCGELTEKVILSAPMGIVDIPAYVSPTSGRWINSRRERNEDLKASNARPWEGMEQEQKEAERHKAYTEQKEDQALTVAAEQAFAQLEPEKKRILEQAVA